MSVLADRVIREILRNLALPGAVRLFHGRGGAFPELADLCIDYFPPVLLLQSYRDQPLDPEFCAEIDAFLRDRGLEIRCVLAQDRARAGVTWRCLRGTPPDAPYVQEGQLRYGLQLMKSQNIGFFPDMRLGRERVASLAPGRRVLNLFAYTCAFSVAAMAAGARSCVNMDLASAALTRGRENHRRNGLALDQVSFLAMDVLKSFGKLVRLGPFDLVVIDPPSNQEGFRAERDYPKLLRRLPEFLAEGAEIIACLNAPQLGPEFLDELFVGYEPVSRLGRPPEYHEPAAEQGLKIHHYRYHPCDQATTSSS